MGLGLLFVIYWDKKFVLICGYLDLGFNVFSNYKDYVEYVDWWERKKNFY